MKIIIVGCGKIGLSIVKQLIIEKKHDITVIDKNQDVINDITNNFDVMGLVGNGASYSVQREAQVEKTDLLIAVTGSDEINLLCCLFARKAGNCNTIARVRDPLYSKEIQYIKDELGLSMIINPEYAAAVEISRLLRFPSADKIDTFAKGRVELLNIVITEDSPFADKTLIEVSKRVLSDILICTVERGDDIFIPNGPFILRAGDKITIVASAVNSREFFTKIGFDTHQVKDTMIVGGGRMTYYLAEILLKMGIRVKVVDSDRERCESLSEMLPKATIINGDATNQEVLIEEGIEGCDSFVSLTGIDETNIFLSLFAKTKTQGKVVTKIDRISFDDIISTFNLGSLIYPDKIAADYIVSYVRAMQNTIGSNVETMIKLNSGRVEALEFKITSNSPIIGRPLMELNLKRDILIGCINRKGTIIIPKGQSVVEAGDTVIVVTTRSGLSDIKDILE
ncbi:MAG: Trk system potassium transporter TrkA [Lachnospiraceae bacterium]|nr:Trk system potassium transporter TrkA [Lachnospiraceae bacterium]MBP5276562.1 Trk system potassium transporter TrkA [Lachnospiraceae bacterium]